MKGYGISDFLDSYPLLSLKPHTEKYNILIEGMLKLNHVYQNDDVVRDSYQLRIAIPSNYPKELPIVKEIGGRIPRNGEFHVNPDGSFCLGSPLRLHLALSKSDNINVYMENYLITFLYAVSLKLFDGSDFVFGELPHGSRGEVIDYQDMFGVDSKDKVLTVLKMFQLKKRIANKRRCPCGCGNRLGVCDLHYIMNNLRDKIPKITFIQTFKRISCE